MARKKESGPLGDDTLRRIDALLAECQLTAEYLAKCERCGLDVIKEQKDNESQRRMAAAIKREFFPTAK